MPARWREVAFENLRAEGAVLASGAWEGGRLRRLEPRGERGGEVHLALPADARVGGAVVRAGTEAAIALGTGDAVRVEAVR